MNSNTCEILQDMSLNASASSLTNESPDKGHLKNKATRNDATKGENSSGEKAKQKKRTPNKQSAKPNSSSYNSNQRSNKVNLTNKILII